MTFQLNHQYSGIILLRMRYWQCWRKINVAESAQFYIFVVVVVIIIIIIIIISLFLQLVHVVDYKYIL
jgi:magnesium-transporting ATPase (P-type)